MGLGEYKKKFVFIRTWKVGREALLSWHSNHRGLVARWCCLIGTGTSDGSSEDVSRIKDNGTRKKKHEERTSSHLRMFAE